jgi:hypothetical protein
MIKINRLWGFETHTQSGLSLIEVCIITLVVSLLLIPALQVMTLERKSNEITKHNGSALDLSNALVNYALENGAYPIPAAPKLAVNNAKVFMPATGAEIPGSCAGNGAEGTTLGAGLPGNLNGLICRPRYTTDNAGNQPTSTTLVERQVYIGTLPVSVLGLPPEMGLDENGHKFTYIVNRILTNPATFNDAKGSIIIADIAGVWKSTAAQFVIISHGQSGNGGWTRGGALIGAACQGDAENGNQYQCKNAVPATGNQLGGYARATFRANGTQQRVVYEGTTAFDDSVAFKTSVYGRLWTPRDDGANPNEYFSALNNVGVGAINGGASPTQKFTLMTGNALATQPSPTAKATVKSPRFCDAASSKCFMTTDVAETMGPTAPIYCGTSVGLKSVSYVSSTTSAGKTCYALPIRTAPLTLCPLGIIAVTTTGDPICAN